MNLGLLNLLTAQQENGVKFQDRSKTPSAQSGGLFSQLFNKDDFEVKNNSTKDNNTQLLRTKEHNTQNNSSDSENVVNITGRNDKPSTDRIDNSSDNTDKNNNETFSVDNTVNKDESVQDKNPIKALTDLYDNVLVSEVTNNITNTEPNILVNSGKETNTIISASSSSKIDNLLQLNNIAASILNDENGNVIINNNLLQIGTESANAQAINTSEPQKVIEIAENVLKIVKDDLSKPSITKDEALSEQIALLLNNQKSGEPDTTFKPITTTATSTPNSGSAQSLQSGSNQDLNNQNGNNSGTNQQNQQNTQTLKDLNIDIANNKQTNIKNAITENNELPQLPKQFNNSGNSANATGQNQLISNDFVKFTKVLNNTEVSNQNNTTNRFADVKDITAQIKFGLNNASKGERNITIDLHPKELGSVNIKMELGSEGHTKVTIIAEKADTLNLLQRESGSLKEILQDALKTEGSNLSFTFHDRGNEGNNHSNTPDFGSNYGQYDEIDNDQVINNNASYYYTANFNYNEGLDIKV